MTVKWSDAATFFSTTPMVATNVLVGLTAAAGTNASWTAAVLKTYTSLSPTLVTPALGTPASGTLTSCTGLPPAGVVGTAAILGANSFTSGQGITPLTDVTGLTVRRNTAGATNIVSWQTESSGALGGVGNTGTVISGNPSTATGGVVLYNAGSAHATTLQAGAAAAARTYTWPTNFGSAGTSLTDAAGNGTLSWAAGGITVGKAIAMAMIFGG